MSILLEDVGKSFDNRIIFEHLNLQLNMGERYCLFGPSGCGKTTLLRVIAGLTAPDTGTVSRDPNDRLGIHFQENRLLPWKTVKENLSLVMSEEDARKWLKDAELEDTENKYPHELSGGMKRRVSLIRALGSDSHILLLDEPLRELDDAIAGKMIQLIDYAAKGKMLVLVTHDVKQAERLGCKMILLGNEER